MSATLRVNHPTDPAHCRQTTNPNDNQGQYVAEKKNSKPSDAVDHPAEPADSENLGKIRNLLFGAQMEYVEERINQLETSLKKESDDLSASFSSELKDLRKDIQASNKQLEKTLAGINASLDDLKKTKTDRSALAALLRGIADQIGGE